MTWLVLWVNNRRIGSVALNDHNLDLVRRLFKGYLLQRDLTGTEHWELRRAPRGAELRGLEFQKK